MVAVRNIPSDCTSLSYAKEESITKLPASPEFKLLAPNSYSGDFAAVVEYMTSNPIGSGRSTKKGIPVNFTVTAGFEADIRQDWVQPFLPGFFFNFAIETPNTNTFNPKATGNATLASVSGTAYVGTNLSDFKANTIVVGRGFSTSGNNGVKTLSAASATSLTTTGLTAEASPPKTANVETCGFIAQTAPSLTVSGNEITIALDKLKSGGDLELQPGTFIYIGGDGDSTKYSSGQNNGWARIKRVTTTGVVCDLTTFTPTANAGTGLSTLQVYIPTRLYKDHITCDNSRRTSYQLERRLGKADTTDAHEQSQLITGAVPNQIDITMPNSDKIMTTMTFVCARSLRRTGAQAPWSGTRTAYDRTTLYNTTTDLKYAVIYRHDRPTANPTDIFGKIESGSLVINNNCAPIPVWGVRGAYDVNVGKFNVNCDVEALFVNVESLNLSEEAIDAGIFIVVGRGNSGFIIDIPLLTIKTSAVNAATNEPLKVSLTNEGNESIFGYACSMQYFDYLPTEATAYDEAS